MRSVKRVAARDISVLGEAAYIVQRAVERTLQAGAADRQPGVVAPFGLRENAGNVVQNRSVAQVIRQLSLQAHYSTSFLIGVIRFEDIVFFVGLIVAMLFVTTRLIESRRWR